MICLCKIRVTKSSFHAILTFVTFQFLYSREKNHPNMEFTGSTFITKIIKVVTKTGLLLFSVKDSSQVRVVAAASSGVNELDFVKHANNSPDDGGRVHDCFFCRCSTKNSG